MAKGITRRELLRIGAGAAIGAAFAGRAPIFSHSGPLSALPEARQAKVIRHVKTRVRKVALTFDDLWNEYNTERICRGFYKRDIPLTLFPVGRALANNLNRPNTGYENLYPRLRDMGHEFGCHLYTHRDIRDFSLQQLMDEEFLPSLRVLRSTFGARFKPLGIRPPYGVLTDELRELSVRQNLPLILWGLDSQDAICTRDHGAEECEETILGNYKRYLRPGTIILLHHAIKAFLPGNRSYRGFIERLEYAAGTAFRIADTCAGACEYHYLRMNACNFRGNESGPFGAAPIHMPLTLFTHE